MSAESGTFSCSAARSDHQTVAFWHNSELILEDGESPEAEVPIRAATISGLIRATIQIFNLDGSALPDCLSIPNLFFQMHRWWDIPSSQLAQNLIQFASDCKANDSETILKKVCYVFRYWFTTFPDHLLSDDELNNIFEDFKETLPSNLKSILNFPKKMPPRCRKESILNTRGTNCRVSLIFDQLNPKQLAEHITFLEYETLRAIPWHEFRDYISNGGAASVLVRTPRLSQAITQFNGLTQWVLCMVLNKTTPEHRATLISKYINLAEELLALANFNSLMAVVGALAHSALARLSKTLATLSLEARNQLDKLVELLSSNNNFSAYRRALLNARSAPFRFPIL